jgi:hypothetical protein
VARARARERERDGQLSRTRSARASPSAAGARPRTSIGAHQTNRPPTHAQVVVIGMSLGYILFVTVLHIIGKVREER